MEPASEQANIDPLKFAGKKSKAAAKQGSAKTQWGILRDSGIPEAEIPNFRCPPPLTFHVRLEHLHPTCVVENGQQIVFKSDVHLDGNQTSMPGPK